MKSKTLIDAVRAKSDVSLPMARKRDMIARLLYDKSYPQTQAAEQVGKLSGPSVDESRTVRLAQDYGNSIMALAKIAVDTIDERALPFKALRPVDIATVAKVAARRPQPRVEEITFGPDEPGISFPPDFPEQTKIRRELEQVISGLPSAAISELAALTWLGRGDASDYPLLLAHAQQVDDPQTPTYLAAKAPLHRYLAQGVQCLGECGQEIMEHFPELQAMGARKTS